FVPGGDHGGDAGLGLGRVGEPVDRVQVGLRGELAAQQLHAQEDARRLDDVAQAVVAHQLELAGVHHRPHVLAVDAHLAGHAAQLGDHVQPALPGGAEVGDEVHQVEVAVG